jgi:3-methyladenine DNA glycosylase AlkD
MLECSGGGRGRAPARLVALEFRITYRGRMPATTSTKRSAAQQGPAKQSAAQQGPAKQGAAKPSPAKRSVAKSPASKPAARKHAAAGVPDAAEVLAELTALGKPSAAKMYARHGVKEPSVGLSAADLQRLVKRLGVQNELALELWQSGVHDARVLATKLADPGALSVRQLEAWLGEASNYVIVDALSALAAQLPGARELALRWTRAKTEWSAAAGWNVLAQLALAGELAEAGAGELLERIERDIHAAANRVRHSMNGALIAIGGALPGLRERALAAAERIGSVEVDHGQTGCKTPEAAPYIRRMAAHAARRGK